MFKGTVGYQPLGFRSTLVADRSKEYFQREGEWDSGEQMHRSLGCCFTTCLLWSSNQLGLNWVSEWKGAIRLSLFHPVSQRQACFVTHVWTDPKAFHPSDPLREKAAPGLFSKPHVHLTFSLTNKWANGLRHANDWFNGFSWMSAFALWICGVMVLFPPAPWENNGSQSTEWALYCETIQTTRKFICYHLDWMTQLFCLHPTRNNNVGQFCELIWLSFTCQPISVWIHCSFHFPVIVIHKK